jgi:hypothetical protein
MAVEQKTLMFNKNGSKTIIGALPKETDRSKINTAEVYLMDIEYDPTLQYWKGPYDTGSLKNIADINLEGQLIEEDLLDANVGDNIENAYPLYKQINIIIDMLNQSSIPNTPEFTAMLEYIQDERDRNNARKEVYKDTSSPYTFVSKEDIEKSIKDRLNIE